MNNRGLMLSVALLVLIPIIIYLSCKIFIIFDIKNRKTFLARVKIFLLTLSLLSDNISALFLHSQENNFENLYQYSHYICFICMFFAFLIPGELSLCSDMMLIWGKTKEKCISIFNFRKTKKQVHEMIPLKLNDTQTDPKETFENIAIQTSNREEIREKNEEKNSDRKNTDYLAFFVCIIFFICFIFIKLDIFAKLKRVLSIMDTPKIIDFFNYPCFLGFTFILSGKLAKNIDLGKGKFPQSNLKLFIFVFKKNN